MIVFFGRFFFPELSLVATPEYNRSDSVFFHYPVKVILGDSLKNGRLPLWTNRMGIGFPVFAEGQIGALYLPNLILFLLFEPFLAFNLSFLVSSIIAFLGMFLLVRSYQVDWRAAWLSGLVFCFSGFFVLHMIHLPMIQAASFLPWMWWLGRQVLEKKSALWMVGLSLAISQQIFAGYFQIAWISVLGLFVLVGLESFRKKIWGQLLKIFFGVGLGVLLAMPQLAPTWELMNQSKKTLVYEKAFEFDAEWKSLLTTLNPMINGSPKTGDYLYQGPRSNQFWEANFYIGLMVMVISIREAWFRRKEKPWRGLLMIGILGLMLSLGDNTPFGAVFQLPGMGVFRVPARYLLIYVVVAVVFFAKGLEKMVKKNRKHQTKMLVVLTLLIVGELVLVMGNYNSVIEKSRLEEMIAVDLPTDGRVRTDASVLREWQEIYRSGWGGKMDELEELYAGLGANINVLADRQSVGLYAGMAPERMDMFYANFDQKKINLVGGKYLISRKEIKEDNMLDLETINKQWWWYKNVDSRDQFRLAEEVVFADDVEQAREMLENFIGFGDVLEGKRRDWEKYEGDIVELVESDDNQIRLKAQTQGERLVVVGDLFYPGWRVWVNGIEKMVLPVNLVQKGVWVGPGESEVVMRFKPDTFMFGIKVMGMGVVVMGGILVNELRKSLVPPQG